MTKLTETPTDQLYEEGVPLHPERIIRYADVEIASPVKAMIDWNQDIEMDEDTRFAVCSAVAHYHYVKTSNVLLCDHILSNRDVPKQLRAVARMLLVRNAEELEAWSKYVIEGGGCGPMGDVQAEYNQAIWNQDDVLARLLGVHHINIAADTSYQQFRHGEPVFQQLTDHLYNYNQAVYPAVNATFRDIIQDMGRRERLHLLRQAAQQVDLIQLIGRERSNKEVFNILGTTDLKLIYGTGKNIKSFYDDIELANGLIPDLI